MKHTAPALNETHSNKKGRYSGLKSLGVFLKPHKGLLVAVLVSLLTASISTLIIPMAFRFMIDHGFEGENPTMVYETFIALFAIAGIMACATAMRYGTIARLGELVIRDIRKTIFDHVLSFDPSITDDHKPNSLLMRLTADTLVIHQVVGAGASVALRNTLLFLGGLVMMFLTAPFLAMLCLLIIPVVLIPVIVLGRRVKALSKQAQEKLDSLNNIAEEVFQSLVTVQSFAAEKMMKHLFFEGEKEAFQLNRKRIFQRAFLTFIIIFLVFSSIVGILWLGVSSVSAGTLTGGALAQFVLYAVFTAGATASLSEVGSDLQKASLAMDRIADILSLNPVIQGGKHLLTVGQNTTAIQFENVGFVYPSRLNSPVLTDVNFTIQKGEKIAIVGGSGSGKTTILQLILHLREKTSGSIQIFSSDIETLSLQNLRQNISYVSQDPVIFDSSLEDNLRLAYPEVTEEQILSALSNADLLDFMQGLPDGLKTMLGTRGTKLSGGQKQRIAIARAFLKNAPLVLLDEATSALDSMTEKRVQDALDLLMKDRTVLIVAHRLSTVLDADRILVLDKGRIVEEGSHTALMELRGVYYRFAERQLQLVEI